MCWAETSAAGRRSAVASSPWTRPPEHRERRGAGPGDLSTDCQTGDPEALQGELLLAVVDGRSRGGGAGAPKGVVFLMRCKVSAHLAGAKEQPGLNRRGPVAGMSGQARRRRSTESRGCRRCPATAPPVPLRPPRRPRPRPARSPRACSALLSSSSSHGLFSVSRCNTRVTVASQVVSSAITGPASRYRKLREPPTEGSPFPGPRSARSRSRIRHRPAEPARASPPSPPTIPRPAGRGSRNRQRERRARDDSPARFALVDFDPREDQIRQARADLGAERDLTGCGAGREPREQGAQA